MNQANNARIFISYSHRGNGPEWKAALIHGLRVFEQHHLLDVWQDGKIRVSSFWDDDIKRAMADARLAVVLVTKEALESEYILAEEFPVLRERQQRDKLPVFPVICEPCDWRSHDWLRATQAPNSSNPLSELKPEAQQRVFCQLATTIAEELSHVALGELPPSSEPLGDDHIYLDRLPLTRSNGPREEKFIGREQELALLDLAFAQSHTSIVSLVAWGGVGKTMLVQQWLQCLQHEGWFGARRVYAWSFYSQGTKEDRQASEDIFLAHALDWFGVQCEPTLSPWDKGRLLADAVARERTLLILDGIEPLQYPPGPMGGQLRAPGVQSLLKQLARKANDTEHCGLCVVTTREPLTDLADFERRPDNAWGSVLRVNLGNLTAEAGAALLHHAGAKRAGAAEIKADDTELLAASREVDGHALTLNLLGRFLARAHSGDIRRRDLVQFDEADRKEQGGTTFKMLAAFENWFARSGEFGARQLAALRMLGLFNRPADAGCIAALRKPPVIVGLTDPLFTTRLDASTGQATAQPLLDEDWNTVTSFLADFGLVVIQADNGNTERLLDCHPLIREHFANQVRDHARDNWHSAHNRLYEHLRDSTPTTTENLGGLLPLYEAVGHGCNAERHVEALDDLLRKRIHRGDAFSSLKRFGAYSEELAALRGMFDDSWSQPHASFTLGQKASLLGHVAFLLRAVGRLQESVEPIKASLRLFMLATDDNTPTVYVASAKTNLPFLANITTNKEAAIAANNLSELLLTLGMIKEAIMYGQAAVDLAAQREQPFWIVAGLTVLADAKHQAGQGQEVTDLFQRAEDIQKEIQPTYPLLYSVWGFRFCNWLLEAAEACVLCAELNQPSNLDVRFALNQVIDVHLRATKILSWQAGTKWKHEGPFDEALTRLALARAIVLELKMTRAQMLDFSSRMFAWIYHRRWGVRPSLASAEALLDTALNLLRASVMKDELPRGLLMRADFHVWRGDWHRAETDLIEAEDIALRSGMKLYQTDAQLIRARWHVQSGWKKAKGSEREAELAKARMHVSEADTLVKETGYRRREIDISTLKLALGMVS